MFAQAVKGRWWIYSPPSTPNRRRSRNGPGRLSVGRHSDRDECAKEWKCRSVGSRGGTYGIRTGHQSKIHRVEAFVSENFDGVYFVGHHSDEYFGATPYLLETQQYGWIMIDTPKHTKSALMAVDELTVPEGPSYMFLTHVDDTAGHDEWKKTIQT